MVEVSQTALPLSHDLILDLTLHEMNVSCRAWKIIARDFRIGKILTPTSRVRNIDMLESRHTAIRVTLKATGV